MAQFNSKDLLISPEQLDELAGRKFECKNRNAGKGK